jgi:hypothetical protein
MLFCCPGEYRTRAIGLRWFLGPRLRDATRRMRSCLQLHRQCFERSCDASQPREVQRICREIRRGSRFGDRSRQTRLGLRQTLQHLWPRDMERLRRKCAMLGLLDRATKLTSSQGENREYWTRDSNRKLGRVPINRAWLLLDVRYAPIADQIPHRSETTLSAKSGSTGLENYTSVQPVGRSSRCAMVSIIRSETDHGRSGYHGRIRQAAL